ncbi:MAG: viroplasmin family protein [Paludibacteraceae bacterium]
MAKNKPKFYVVWEGNEPGIYTSWKECEKQTKGFPEAKFKSFETMREANNAFLHPWYKYIGKNAEKSSKRDFPNYKLLPKEQQPVLESIAVDAACSGNPGKMEYRGVDVKTGCEIFRFGPIKEGTNNIGEFLAIVHALALFYQNNPSLTIYTDSRTALKWVNDRKHRSRLSPSDKNVHLFSLLERAETWLQNNTYKNPVLKWETEKWGEIPADFGRK